MDTRLVVFLAVARIGQLTEASRQLNLSPSSVSQSISGLETDLGALLFARGHRGMTLTAGGQVLFTTAVQIEALWNRTRRDVSDQEDGSSRLRIAASHTAAELFLPRPLGRFRSRWPHTRVHLVMNNSQSVIDLVEDGHVDVGLIEGAVASGRLHHEALWADELALMVSVHHPLARRATVSLVELPRLDWILRESGSGTRRVFERALTRHGLSVDDLTVMMELSSLRSIIAMVANEVGVSVLSRSILESEEITVQGVVAVPIEGLNLSRSIEVITSRAAAGQHLVDFIGQLRHDVELRERHR